MNSDYEKRALIDTNTIQWQETQTKDVFKKILAIKDEEETSFIKLNKKYFGMNKLDNKIIDWQFCELYKDSPNCLLGHFLQKDSDTLLTNEILSDFQVGFKGLKQGSIVSFQNLKEKSDQKKYYRIS